MVQKISNLLRFKNGFEIRDLYHFVSKNVSHTITQILRATEIQQFKSNQLFDKESIILILGQILKIVTSPKNNHRDTALTEDKKKTSSLTNM